MTTQEPPRTVVQRWLDVQAAVGPIAKDRKNKDQNFNFRGVDQVLDACHDLLAENRVFVRPKVLERIPETRVTANNRNLNVVHLRIEFTAVGDAGDEYVIGELWGEAQDSGDKATSKAVSIAYKYVMFTALSIPVGADGIHDPDSSAEEAGPRGRQQQREQFDEDDFAGWYTDALTKADDKDKLTAAWGKLAEFRDRLSRPTANRLREAWEAQRDAVAAAQQAAEQAAGTSADTPPAPGPDADSEAAEQAEMERAEAEIAARDAAAAAEAQDRDPAEK